MEIEMNYNIDNNNNDDYEKFDDVNVAESDLTYSYIENEKRMPKQKKEKPFKKLLYQIGKKRKRNYAPSFIQQVSNELVKRRALNENDVNSYLIEKKHDLTARDKKLFNFLVTTKVINGNITLSDNLTNKPLYFYYSVKNVETKTFTNDSLYVACLVSRTADQANIVNKTIINKCVDVDYIQIVSNSFECTGDIKKGFYQDYTGEFAAIGLSILNQEEKNKILDMSNKWEFLYKNIKYYGCGDNNSCVIVQSDLVGNVKDYYNSMKIFSNLKSTNNISEKTFELVKKVKFIDSKLKPDSFCPAFMLLPENVKCDMMIRFKYDYNMLFRILDELYVANEKKNLIAPPNMIYWNCINEGMDFIAIYSITSLQLTDPHRTFIHNFYNVYETYKPVINLWKENQLESQHILFEFYNSFNTRIMYDKMTSIYKKVNYFLENRETLENDETFKTIKEFFGTISEFAGWINNQLDVRYVLVFRKLQAFLKQFINGKGFNEDMLERQLYNLGMAIYDLTESGRDKSKFPCFPNLLSPGAFFGDVTNSGKLKSRNILKEYINDYKKKLGKVQEEQKVKERSLKEFTDYITKKKNLKNNIKNTIIKINQDEGWQLEDDYINDLLESYFEYIDTEDGEEDFEKIKDHMIKKYMSGVPLKDIVLELEDIGDFIAYYMDELYNNNKIEDLKEESDRLQDEVTNTINQIETNKKKYARKKKKTEGVVLKGKNEKTINSDYSNGFYVYPTNEVFKQAMQDYRDNEFVKRKLKAYWLDLARLSGVAKVKNKDKWYEQIFSGGIGDIYNGYNISDVIISKICYDNDLPTLDQVLTTPTYSTAYAIETPKQKVTMQDVGDMLKQKNLQRQDMQSNYNDIKGKIVIKRPRRVFKKVEFKK